MRELALGGVSPALAAGPAGLLPVASPERLLELVYRFTLFDTNVKKVARYQQYFAIGETMARGRKPGATRSVPEAWSGTRKGAASRLRWSCSPRPSPARRSPITN